MTKIRPNRITSLLAALVFVFAAGGLFFPVGPAQAAANITIANAMIIADNEVLVSFSNLDAGLLVSVDASKWHINNYGSPLTPVSAVADGLSPGSVVLTFNGTPFSDTAKYYLAADGLYVDANGAADNSGPPDTNAVIASGASIAIADGQSPRLESAQYLDQDGNGTVETIRTTWSENVTIPAVGGSEAVDWTITGGDITAAFVSAPQDLTASKYLDVTVTADAGETSGATNPTIAYDDGDGTHSVIDAAGNAAGTTPLPPGAVIAVTDGAGPVVTAIFMADLDSNGKVDNLRLIYTEVLKDTAPAANGFDVTSAADHGTCDAESADPDGSNILGVTFSCSGINTAVGDLNAVFTANVGVTDALGNQSPTKTFTGASTPAIIDLAKPMIAYVTIEDTAVEDALIDKITFTWSENIDTDDSVAPVAADMPTTYLPDGKTVVFAGTGITDPAGVSNKVVVTGITDQVTKNTAAGATAIEGDLSLLWKDMAAIPNTPDATEATNHETIVDLAKPLILSAATDDADSNGYIDRIVFTFSEDIDATSVDIDGSDFTVLGYLFPPVPPNPVVAGETAPGVVTLILTENIGPPDTAAIPLVGLVPGIIDANGVLDLAVPPNANNGQAFGAAADYARPALFSTTTADTNIDGTVDQITLAYSENVSIVDAGIGFQGVAFSNGCTAADVDYSSLNTTFSVVTVSGCTPGDTSITPAVTYDDTAGDIIDKSPQLNEMNDGETVAGTDGAAPVPISASYLDNNLDGTVDRVAVVFSEPVLSYTFDPLDWVIDTNGAINLTSFDSLLLPDAGPPATGVGTATLIFTVTTTLDITGGLPKPQIHYKDNNGAGQISDGAPNPQTGTTVKIDVDDAAAPAPIHSDFYDELPDWGPPTYDGRVSYILVDMSEDVANYTHDNAAWNPLGSNGDLNMSVFDGWPRGPAQILLEVSSDIDETSTPSFPPTITYTDTLTSDLSDGIPNSQTGPTAPLNVDDAAAPAPIQAVFQDQDDDGTVDHVVVTLSEDMNYTWSTVKTEWFFLNNSALNLAAFDGAKTAANQITLDVTADADETGASPLPTIFYDDAPPPPLGDLMIPPNLQTGPTVRVDVEDDAQPVILGAYQSGTYGVRIHWTEPVLNNAVDDGGALFLENYFLPYTPVEFATSAVIHTATPDMVDLTFADAIIAGIPYLGVENVEDYGRTGADSASDDINRMEDAGPLTILIAAIVSGLEVQPNQTFGNTVTVTGTATSRATTTITMVRYCMVDSVGTTLPPACDLTDNSTWADMDPSDGSWTLPTPEQTEEFEKTGINISSLAPGTITVHVAAQNSETVFGAADQVTFTKSPADTAAPPVPVFSTASATVNADAYTISGTAGPDAPSDSTRTIKVYKGGTTLVGEVVLLVGQTDWAVSVPLTQGAANSFTATSTDASGNPSAATSTPVVITENSSGPVLRVTSPTPGQVLPNATSFAATFDNDGDGGTAFYSLNGGIWVSCANTSATITPLVVGTNTLQVRSTKTVTSTVIYGYSPVLTFTVQGDTTPPTITVGPAVTPAQTTATITWTTDELATDRVQYGVTAAYGHLTAQDLAADLTSHSVTVTGLTCGTAYRYGVISADAAGNTRISADAGFSTTACTDTIAPTPAVSITNITTTTADVIISVDQNADRRVEVATDSLFSSNLCTNASCAYTGATAAGPFTVNVTGPAIAANTTYFVRVTVSDQASGAGNVQSLVTAFTTNQLNAPVLTDVLAAPDGTNPSTKATVSWSTKADNNGEPGAPLNSSTNRVQYGLTQTLGTEVATTDGVSSHSLLLTGLTPGRTYFYRVKSTANGKTSFSQIFSFTTAPADTGLSVDSIAATQTYALPDNTYGNGFAWTFNVTVNNPTETDVAMRFAQWASGANLLNAAGNMEYSTDNTTCAAGDTATCKNITANSTYGPNIDVSAIDLDPTRGGRQVRLFVKMKVPVATPGGSYSTSYGVQSSPVTPP